MKRTVPILIVIPILTSAFYTRHSPDTRTNTHETITEVGTLQALSSYIWKTKLKKIGSEISAVEVFYVKDATSKIEMGKSINAIIQAIADTQVEKKDTAYVHCHADQILLAHQHVTSCKDKLIQLKNDVVELRKQLGECLYTVQSFYSNTNWVEMYGDVPYTDFGIKGKRLMAVALPEEDTCKDVENIDLNCEQNIILQNKLTSGYHHGRGNIKPTRPIGSTTGKCSHGGPYDESRKMVAKCGINKETYTEHLSPHHHLHYRAYISAVTATKDFFIMEDTGILSLLGVKTFDEIFHIKTRKDLSLAFVIDYSGSMKEEIAAVKEQITQLVTATIGSDNEPADYVLSLFNDPVTLNEASVFRDGYEMIKKLDSIIVDGGGDCPEFAADGILKAINNSRNGSTLFVFTDADAKDDDKQQEAANMAMAKTITITTVLTGTCSRRRRSVHNIHVKRRDTTSFFQRLAQATGGEVYRTRKEEINAVLNDIIEKTFPVAEVILDSFEWSLTSNDNTMFVVDSTVTVLKVAVCCSGEDSGIELFYPNGTKETFTSRLSRKLVTKRKEVIISLQRPPPGIYNLQRKLSNKWSVNVTAQSPVKLETEILEYTESGALPILKGSPIAGKNYTFYVNIYNLGENGTCNDLILTDMLGNTLFNVPIIQTTTLMAVRCAAIFTTPNQFFQLKLNGTDKNGFEFSRKNSLVFKPTNVKLRIIPPDSAVTGKEVLVYYEVENTGTINETYEVAISDDHSASVLPMRRQHTILAGDRSNGSFTMKPTLTSSILKYAVTVYLGSSSEITQRISKTVLVTDIERPVCTVVTVNGSCNNSSLNTAQCHKYQWFAKAEITFKGTELENFTSSVGSAIELVYDDISGLRHGPVNISIKGSCCTPSVVLAAVDTDGYIAQCRIEFSGGQIVTPTEFYDISPVETDKSVTDIERPVCTVVTVNGSCNNSSLNTAQCHKYKWFAKAEITFKGTELENFTSSVGSATELVYDDISGLRHGPVNISIKGSCCTPSVVLAAVDTDGYIAQCRIEFSGGQIVTPTEFYDIDISPVETDKSVTDIERPVCTVVTVNGSCNNSSLNTAQCHKYKWFAKAEITFKGTELENFTSSVGSATELVYDDISGLRHGPVNISIKGSCCTPSVVLAAVDTDGYIAQCRIEFSGGQIVTPTEFYDIDFSPVETDKSVTDIERPVCTVVTVNGSCNNSSLNTAQCHKYKWFAKAEITFKGTELENFTSSVGSATELVYDDISGLRHGPVNISIKGSCCTPSVVLAAVDTDGYIAQCRIEFSGGQIVTPTEFYDIDFSPVETDKSDGSYTVIVIAIVVGVIIVVVLSIIGFIAYRKFKQASYNVNYNVNQSIKEGIDKNQRPNIVEYHPVKLEEVSDEKENL